VDKQGLDRVWGEPHESARILPARGELETNASTPPGALRAVVVATDVQAFGRALIDIRAGQSTPHRANQELLRAVVRRLGLL
jgi:hypothetical protein